MESIKNRFNNNTVYLVYCSYVIAAMDLLSALLYAVVTVTLYFKFHHWTSLAALGFTTLWFGVIVSLLAGIWLRRLSFVRFWLIFTCVGIASDAILMLYGFTLAMSVDWEGVKITIVPFIGLAVEMTFVYIVYLLYVEMITSDELQCDGRLFGRSKGGYDKNSMQGSNSDRSDSDKRSNSSGAEAEAEADTDTDAEAESEAEAKTKAKAKRKADKQRQRYKNLIKELKRQKKAERRQLRRILAKGIV